nr:ATP-binding protein [Lysinibacillus timonensis]
MFRSKENPNHIEGIKTKKLTKVYNVKEQKIVIDYLDAQYGQLNGKEVLLDEDNILSTSKDILKVFINHTTKYQPLPTHITISTEMNEPNQEAIKANNMQNKLSLIAKEPRYILDEIYLPPSSKQQIIRALSIVKYSDKLRNEWGLGSVMKEGRASVLNFFGPPGTGKSMTAEAIANYLGKKVITVNYAQLESKYVGETPKNIQKCFEEAENHNTILVFDEADSFLGKRLTNVTQSADYGVNVTRSVMLMELERFTGTVIFTTNLLTNYDQAFKRRIFANIEFTLPDRNGRERIWKTHLPESLPLQPELTTDWLAEKFDHVSGADIKDIVLYAAVNCLNRNDETISKQDFEDAYSYIQARYIDDSKLSIKSEVISEEQYKKEMNL